MADVIIIYTADKQKVSGRLSEAIGSAGYSVDLEKVSEAERLPEVVEQARAASAALLIWSRPFVSVALRKSVLTKVRRQKNVIEVSADGLTPSLEGDDSRVVLLSGWRGQPFHPGWQRILGELKRLCGAPPAPAEDMKRSSPPTAPLVAPVEPPPAATEVRSTGTKRRFATAAILVVGIASLAAGAATWIGRDAFQAEDVSRPQPAAEAPAPVPSIAPSPVQPQVAAPNQGTPAPAAPALAPAEPKPASDSAAAGPPPAPTARESAPRRSAAASSGARERPARQGRAAPKRYSPRNSETMRLFCERSGRSTPQCRTFRRSDPTTPPRVVGPAE